MVKLRFVSTLLKQERLILAILVTCYLVMAGFSATKHSPTSLEPAFIVAGLSVYEFGRFDLFNVNPPLVRCFSAIPVMLCGYEMDWSGYTSQYAYRPEFQIGADFVSANGDRTQWLVILARWVTIPIGATGLIACYYLSKELFRSSSAALFSTIAYTFEPNLLAHGELATTDAPAAALGTLAALGIVKWFRYESWEWAALAGCLLGFANLAKFTWIILFLIWPIAFLIRVIFVKSRLRLSTSVLQLLFVGVVAIFIINVGYGFQKTFCSISDLNLQSSKFLKLSESTIGKLPIPLPIEYLQGLDSQERRFELGHGPTYLGGSWYDDGVWWYYLYGLVAKLPIAFIALALLSLVNIFLRVLKFLRCGRKISPEQLGRLLNAYLVVAPSVVLLIVASTRTTLNQDLRYVLPIITTIAIFSGAAVANTVSSCYDRSRIARCSQLVKGVALMCVGLFVLTTLTIYPHQLAFFNNAVKHFTRPAPPLLFGNLDYGQDLSLVKDFVQRKHIQPEQTTIISTGAFEPNIYVFSSESQLSVEGVEASYDWCFVSVNCLHGDFLRVQPGKGLDNESAKALCVQLGKSKPYLIIGHTVYCYRNHKTLP